MASEEEENPFQQGTAQYSEFENERQSKAEDARELDAEMAARAEQAARDRAALPPAEGAGAAPGTTPTSPSKEPPPPPAQTSGTPIGTGEAQQGTSDGDPAKITEKPAYEPKVGSSEVSRQGMTTLGTGFASVKPKQKKDNRVLPTERRVARVFNDSELPNYDELPQFATVDDVVRHLNRQHNVHFNDRQVLAVGKAQNAVVRIGGVMRLRTKSIRQGLSGLLDDLVFKYNESSDAKRISQFRSFIVRETLLEEGANSVVGPEKKTTGPAETNNQRLERLIVAINQKIIAKNSTIITKIDNFERSTIAQFDSLQELNNYIVNLMQKKGV